MWRTLLAQAILRPCSPPSTLLGLISSGILIPVSCSCRGSNLFGLQAWRSAHTEKVSSSRCFVSGCRHSPQGQWSLIPCFSRERVGELLRSPLPQVEWVTVRRRLSGCCVAIRQRWVLLSQTRTVLECNVTNSVDQKARVRGHGHDASGPSYDAD